MTGEDERMCKRTAAQVLENDGTIFRELSGVAAFMMWMQLSRRSRAIRVRKRLYMNSQNARSEQ